MSLNFIYILEKVEFFYKKHPCDSQRMLDFGCGAGEMLEMAIAKGIDAYGADSYAKSQIHVHDKVSKSDRNISSRIFKIENDVLPFPDNYFDVVVSNQVFEHVESVEKPLHEIHRVLKPGGMFLALFPTRETWWEGHALVYFAHLMKPDMPFQHFYLSSVKKLGFGLDNGISDPDEWAKSFSNYLKDFCFYRSFKEIKSVWFQCFDNEIDQWESDYILFRMRQSGKLNKLAPFFDVSFLRPVFRWLCIKKGGRVFAIQKRV